ncbi:MAG: hypothetical protein HZB76_03795 [Chlamydiae bacterium]|nr:hypothetical protein [Chlamydiota bacterium]
MYCAVNHYPIQCDGIVVCPDFDLKAVELLGRISRFFLGIYVFVRCKSIYGKLFGITYLAINLSEEWQRYNRVYPYA